MDRQQLTDVEKCAKCGKVIPWDEYAVNLGWCKDCLMDDYSKYLASQKLKGKVKDTEF